MEWGTGWDARKLWDGGWVGAGSVPRPPPPVNPWSDILEVSKWVGAAENKGLKRWEEEKERKGKWKINNERTWRQKERKGRAAPISFGLTAWLVLVWVLVSSTDICQPTSPNYCPGSWRSPRTHSWNETKTPWQGRLFLFGEGGIVLFTAAALNDAAAGLGF